MADAANCIKTYGAPKGIQYPLAVPNCWTASYNNPEYAASGGPIPNGPNDPAHVDGWNFQDMFFVTFKQAYLTAIGFDFNNYDIADFDPATNTFTCEPNKWCIAPNPTALHNSPAKPCPSASPTPTPTVPPTIDVVGKALSSKAVKISLKNNTGVAQVLTCVSITWPQATNGNLSKIKFDGNNVYTTSTGGGSLSTCALLDTTAHRTLNPGETDVLEFDFANNVDTNAAHYTGSATFNPFGPVTILP
jgi:hypothetical protein